MHIKNLKGCDLKKINVVILAAGQGKRMNSSRPKVLHKIANKPMLANVINTANKLDPDKIIVVYGHGGDQVKNEFTPENSDKYFDHQIVPNITWVHQDKQLGTGHALRCAETELDNDGVTLLLYGDVPLLSVESLEKMLSKYDNNIVMLTAVLDNPHGYGRIVRDENNQIECVIEEKDANTLQKEIKEINSGIYLFPNARLKEWLSQLSNNNSQNEYYVTDVIEMAYKDGVVVDAVITNNTDEIMGVNNKLQLEYLERKLQLKKAEGLLNSGTTLMDKNRIDIRGDLSVGMDCIIDVNCIFEGVVKLGDNVTIGAGSILNNVTIKSGVKIKPYTLIEDSIVGDNSQIGPFARIRPGTELSDNVHIGNFVEIKKSIVGLGSKVNHLTYIGDSEVGSGVNVGAGSVTCNYDGKNKFKTTIKDNVFVGSGTMMVAPVTIGEGSIIGAGSVITKDAPSGELTVSRAKQVTVTGWLKKNR
jgi:bifunctional UDP-N-acetylglucosamine pyrophosphorylase / glucosamine-1-phosphate N-acetyltransferase